MRHNIGVKGRLASSSPAQHHAQCCKYYCSIICNHPRNLFTMIPAFVQCLHTICTDLCEGEVWLKLGASNHGQWMQKHLMFGQNPFYLKHQPKQRAQLFQHSYSIDFLLHWKCTSDVASLLFTDWGNLLNCWKIDEDNFRLKFSSSLASHQTPASDL